MSKLSKHFKKKQFIGNQIDQEHFTLKCGLEVVYKKSKNSSISHCGITINAGSKDDGKHLGLAHFVEHMLFKGTKNLTAKQILNKIENVGGEINAFTGRQVTCIYTSTMHQFVPRSIDVLSDIFLNSIFPKKEIVKERQVILDEINMYLDSPEDVLFDEYYNLHFKDLPYGRPILGTKNTVKRIKSEHLESFYQSYFTPENAVFSYVGTLSKKSLKQKLEESFKGIKGCRKPTEMNSLESAPTFKYGKFSKTLKEEFNQGYKVIGYPAFQFDHKDRLVLALIANILGGPSLNSRLNLKIREEKGLTYQIEASYNAYKLGGLFTIFFCTEKKNVKRSTELVLKEIKRIKETIISESQLKKAKQQYIGQAIMAEENSSNLMILLGKEQVLYNKSTTIKNFLDSINGIQVSDIQSVSQKVFKNSLRSELKI